MWTQKPGKEEVQSCRLGANGEAYLFESIDGHKVSFKLAPDGKTVKGVHWLNRPDEATPKGVEALSLFE